MYNSVVRMWKKHMIDEKGVDKAVRRFLAKTS